MEVTYGRDYVYSLQYHIVWCDKYRHKVLFGEIEDRLISILHNIFINCSPQHYIPDVIKALKGISTRLLIKEIKEYNDVLKKKLWGGYLWNPSYFIATVSENTEEQIRKYIKNQKVK